jgi:23S rRNA (adenine2503-C2)-methyltransferase
MNFKKIKEVLGDEPKFRLKQAKKLLCVDLIDDWSEASVFSVPLREKLNKEVPLINEGEVFLAKDNKTVKVLLTLEDGLKIETVLIRYKERNTVCVSSQVGCPLGCHFCATGKMGFKRNLKYYEIVNQVIFIAKFLKNNEDFNPRISNIVFMGMGEPFLNYNEVMKAIDILNDKDAFNIGARKISISTVGIVEGINKLAKADIQVNLAISLHNTTNDDREKLMPVNAKYPLKDIFKAVDSYIENTNRKVMFEYIMIDGVNDSVEKANELVKLMENKLYVVNLISYNPTGIFNPSRKERIKEFRSILENKGISVTERISFGEEINAACGQLLAKDNDDK